MKIRHPASFSLLIAVCVATAGLSVLWSAAHMVAVLGDLAAIAALRWISHWEGRRDA
jgi:uncharacterized membrane protein